MSNKKYKPKLDKLYWILFISTNLICVGITVIPLFSDFGALIVTIPTLLFVNYFFISPLFGYVELREETLFIKYGFFLKKEIKYSKIRKIEKQRRFYSESMMSLKNAIEHVEIKYNSFDVTTVSVVDNHAFISAVEERIALSKNESKPN